MARLRISLRTLFIQSQSFTAKGFGFLRKVEHMPPPYPKRAGRILPVCHLYNAIGAQRFEPKPISVFCHSLYAGITSGFDFDSGRSLWQSRRASHTAPRVAGSMVSAGPAAAWQLRIGPRGDAGNSPEVPQAVAAV